MDIQIPIEQLDPDYLMYGGAIGILLGLLFFIYFLYRRIRWIILVLRRRGTASPGLLSSLRNLILIVLWTSVFGMALFLGFFLRSYYAFTYEEPVAEVDIQSSDAPHVSRITVRQFHPEGSQSSRHFLIKGDQWVIEGDILKWEHWLNFLGLHTRYRLTRLTGRYVATAAEMNEPRTAYSLTEDEDHPFWRYLYQYGHQLPFVNTVYGNAVFQAVGGDNRYVIYVGTSGFVVRQTYDNGHFVRKPIVK
jgi:hypothetical protein